MIKPCAVEKLLDKKTIEEQMGVLGLKETIDGSARAIGVR